MASYPKAAPKKVYYLVRTRSLFSCFLHWVFFLSVVVLILTGFYIASPLLFHGHGEAFQAYIMGYARLSHFVAATFLIAGFALRLYLSFFLCSRHDILDILPTPKNIAGAAKLAFYYLTFHGPHHIYRYVNPLGGIGVFSLITFCAVQIGTGFLLYLPCADPIFWGGAVPLAQSLVLKLGGLQSVRLIHHIVMFFLMAFIVIHVYLQIWKNTMFEEADIASIFSGYKMFPEEIVRVFDKGFESYEVKEE
ncbi:MAG: Ni/Fe-hydrogenase, b-type cytochrome subunit [Nitrospinae bacterium]|nr:Ni/Fe-hydrogenase, b-type cytochrome subunit [Nitrospinota bacterium]